MEEFSDALQTLPENPKYPDFSKASFYVACMNLAQQVKLIDWEKEKTNG